MAFRVEVDGDFIKGYIGNNKVICLHNFWGDWIVYDQTALPPDVQKAAVYIQCFKAVFDKLEELK